MPEPYAFVSYTRRDRNYVEALSAYLGTSGTSVWFDRDIATGDRYQRLIRERIDNCAVVVVVMTPEAERSEWVEQEVARAKQQQKPILPLLLKGDPMFALSSLNYTDVAGERMPDNAFVQALTMALDSRGSIEAVDGVDVRTPSGVPDYLARNRPTPARVEVDVRVARHPASDIVHEIILATVLTETLYSWPEGSMFVIDYGPDSYVQGTFHDDTLMTEIGVVGQDGLAQAEELGWIDPKTVPPETSEYSSRDIWWENPVKEWTYEREPLANVAAFLARGVERVLNVDPSRGYAIKIFHNNDERTEDVPNDKQSYLTK